CSCTNQPLGWSALLTSVDQLARLTYLPLATLRSVTMPWPQSNTSNCSVSPIVVALSLRSAPSGPLPAVMYLPVARSLNATRSTPSEEVTEAARSRMPSSGVTWYVGLPEYQSV